LEPATAIDAVADAKRRGFRSLQRIKEEARKDAAHRQTHGGWECGKVKILKRQEKVEESGRQITVGSEVGKRATQDESFMSPLTG